MKQTSKDVLARVSTRHFLAGWPLSFLFFFFCYFSSLSIVWLIFDKWNGISVKKGQRVVWIIICENCYPPIFSVGFKLDFCEFLIEIEGRVWILLVDLQGKIELEDISGWFLTSGKNGISSVSEICKERAACRIIICEKLLSSNFFDKLDFCEFLIEIEGRVWILLVNLQGRARGYIWLIFDKWREWNLFRFRDLVICRERTPCGLGCLHYSPIFFDKLDFCDRSRGKSANFFYLEIYRFGRKGILRRCCSLEIRTLLRNN